MSGPVGDNVLRGSGVVKAVTVEGGLDVADQWRQNTNAQMPGSGVLLFDGIAERVDTAGQGTRGSAMTNSSGIWTFPETGIWSVFAQGELYTSNNADGSVKLGLKMEATVNNSSYAVVSEGYVWNPSNQFTYQTAQCESLIDVTDTSNVKIKVSGINGGTNNSDRNWLGGTAINQTFITFLKLGAT